MVLLEELRSIAKSVEFHLGAGTSAEGRAADEIEWLRRRVAALERVIRENLEPSHCGDGPDRKLVDEILRRQANLGALSHAQPTPRLTTPPTDIDRKSDYAQVTHELGGQPATVDETHPEREPEGGSSRERKP